MAGRNVAAVAGDVERRLKDIEFPLEYRAELSEGPTRRLAAQQRAIGAAIAAAIGIFLVLQACVGSWALATCCSSRCRRPSPVVRWRHSPLAAVCRSVPSLDSSRCSASRSAMAWG